MCPTIYDFQKQKINNQSIPEVTIIIPSTDERTLEQVINTAKFELPDAEIILGGKGSTIEIAKRCQVKYLEFDQTTPKSILLNRALEISNGKWIIVLDADAIPEPGWGKSMLAEFGAGTPLFTGSVIIDCGNYWMRAYNLSMLHEFTVGKPRSYRKHIPALNMGFTKETSLKIGPFREDLTRSQDYEWTLRAYKLGIIPLYTPSPVIKHLPVKKNDFRHFWRYWINQGAGNIVVRLMYSDVLNTPFFMKWPLFIFVASPFLAIIPTMRILFTSPKLFL